MKRFLNVRTAAAILFIVIWVLLLPTRLADPLSMTFGNDASQYSGAAINLLQKGIYSIDGITPYFAREPGMSVWLAGIYAVFGIENRVMVFVLQGVLMLAAMLVFTREFTRHAGKRAADAGLFLLVCTAPVYHAVFSLYRESLAISLALVFLTCIFVLLRRQSFAAAAFAGITLGLLTITYTTFLLLPVLLVPLLLFLRVHWHYLLLFCTCFTLALAPWGIRNMLHTGSTCLTGCGRSAIQWHVRGVQTRDLHGLEPLKCLYSEYISRDWTGRSPSCSFNAVMHAQWPQGFMGTPEDIAAGEEGKQMILADIPNYAWVTATDVLELHLPYVNGWGRVYNLLAALSMLIIYSGILFSVRAWREQWAWVFLCIMLYHTAIFSLTDATPRYLLPIIFCYTALAGVGYAGIQFRRWRNSPL